MKNHEKLHLLQKRLNEINAEKDRIEKEIKSLQRELSAEKTYGTPWEIKPETPSEKILIFMQLFRCREDIYTRYWENRNSGKSGYSPVCRNEWKAGICEKPKIRCRECTQSSFIPLDEETVRSHLEGKQIIGTYAIKEDDTCTFLAADFDSSTWKDDVRLFRNAARDFGVNPAIEISRSGNGAHAWIFFQEKVPAVMARRLGTIIMARASSEIRQFNLASYDRFFPSQDYIPDGGFGNLIALPLQFEARKKGNTVFVDDELNPYGDQWLFLSTVKRLSLIELNKILTDVIESKEQLEIADYSEDDICNAERDIDPVADEIHDGLFPETIEMNLSSMVSIDVSSLPPRLITALRRTATFANPKYFELQRMRFSTWNTPRYICCADFDGTMMHLPRGTLDICVELCANAGANVVIRDNRPTPDYIDITFNAELMGAQLSAAREISKHEYGVLVAPPGSGKTVIACYMIAERRVPTLILLHRKQLLDQWKDRISQFLSIEQKEIGVIGGGRKKLKGMIDIAMLQTLTRKEEIGKLIAGYHQIIVDECHHIPAVSFESILRRIPARYILGLTATPYRKDGHQAILYMQCGPVRHEMTERPDMDIEKKVIVRNASFQMKENSEKYAIHEIWEHLVSDESRLDLVASDVISSLRDNHFPLILSERKDHLYNLQKKIIGKAEVDSIKGFLFEGSLGKKARARALDEIIALKKENRKAYILSTGSLIGEGFDLPELDTLFIAMPFSFKGRMVQYAGRLHRSFPGKKHVTIYDYCDTNTGLTISMFKKRLSAYRSMGYLIEETGNEKIDRWIGRGRLP